MGAFLAFSEKCTHLYQQTLRGRGMPLKWLSWVIDIQTQTFDSARILMDNHATDRLENPLLRLAERDRPAAAIIAQGSDTGPIVWNSVQTDVDYTLIDPQLTVAAPSPATADQDRDRAAAPPTGSGYAAWTPGQRRSFLDWALATDQPAPQAFQDLYVAHLEVHLLLEPEWRDAAWAEVEELLDAPAWVGSGALRRAALLGRWAEKSGPEFRRLIERGLAPPELMGRVLGMQALLETPLSEDELALLVQMWTRHPAPSSTELRRQRLASLATSAGAEPLAYAREEVGDCAPLPWRCAHRDLRPSVPQPDLRPLLQPLLNDILTIEAALPPVVDESAPTPLEADAAPRLYGQIVLEFGESRSEYFDYVLTLAQRLDTFQQIMDEDRKLVYRLTFTKGRLRKFWRIWDYVQSWKTTRVYVDGEEIEGWKVWPYSQYLR